MGGIEIYINIYNFIIIIIVGWEVGGLCIYRIDEKLRGEEVWLL